MKHEKKKEKTSRVVFLRLIPPFFPPPGCVRCQVSAWRDWKRARHPLTSTPQPPPPPSTPLCTTGTRTTTMTTICEYCRVSYVNVFYFFIGSFSFCIASCSCPSILFFFYFIVTLLHFFCCCSCTRLFTKGLFFGVFSNDHIFLICCFSECR